MYDHALKSIQMRLLFNEHDCVFMFICQHNYISKGICTISCITIYLCIYLCFNIFILQPK